MRLLVTSEKDLASQTIKSVLIDDYGFSPNGESFESHPILSLDNSTLLVTTQRDMIFCEHLEEYFSPEAFIFCSRHKAESGRPALLAHSTGNLGSDALFGGNPCELSVSAPSLIATALKRLSMEKKERDLTEFDVSLEVTHHGPTSLSTPLVFVELGSSEEYWTHKEGARAVAAAIMDCAKAPLSNNSAVGFGGTHYASKFNKLVLEKGYKIGHMAPKYVLNEITLNVIRQMFKRTTGSAMKAIIDWKGMNAENKEHVLPLLEELGVEIIRDKDA